MFKLKSKSNENRIKVQFNITIQTVKDLPATAFGNDIFVECKRGSKADNHKTTRKVQAKDATVNFEEKIPILCTFIQNAKTKKFEPKKDLTFVIKEARKDAKEKDPKKVGEEIAKVVIDLASYADTNTVKQETLSLASKDKKAKKLSLLVKIETQWLKVGNKLVKKGTGNEDFVLETADEFTETNASFSDNEEEKFPDEDEDNNSNNKKKLEKTESKSSKEPKKGSDTPTDKDQYETEISDLRKDKDRLERKVQRLQEKIDDMEANGPHNPEDANQELEDLRKDKARLEKKVDRLTKEVEKLRDELEKGGSGSGAPSTDNDVEDLKRDNQRLEKKVEKLTKELNDARSQIPASGSSNSEKENFQKQITDLQNQLKAESESKKELQANLDKQTKSQKEAQSKADENEKKIKDLQKQLNEKTTAAENLEKQLKQEKDKGSSKTPVVTSSKEDSSKLKEENAQLKDELKKQQDKESEYKAKISKTKEKKVALKAQVQQLQTQVNSLTQNQSQFDQLKKHNQSLSDEVDQLKAENSKKTQNIQSLEDQLQKLRDLNTSSSSSSSKQKVVVEQLQQQIQQQSQTIKDLQDEIQKIKKDAKQSENSKTDSESKIAQLQAQIEKLQDENEEAKSNLQKSNAKRDQYRKELDKLKDEYDEETERMSAEIAKLKEQNSTSKQPQASTSSGSAASDDKVKKLKEELAEAQNKSKDAETKYKKQLEEKEKEIAQLKQLAAASDSKKPQSQDSSEDSKKLKRIEKELEAYKRKVAALTRQNQELQLLEEVIYSNDNQFDTDKAMPQAVQTLAERLSEWGTLVNSDANTQLLDEITNAVKKSFARSAYDSEGLAYWLSFTSTSFVLLKKDIPVSAQPDDFGTLSRPMLADNLDEFKPVTKFFHELTVVSFDIFSVLLINIYSQLDHILVPNVLETADKKKTQTNEFSNILGDILKLLKKNFLHDQIIKHFLIQIFYFIDCQLFNTLLKRPDLFTCNSGFQIKMALSQVENTITKVDKQWAGLVSKQFNHIKEAVNLLLMDKSIVGDEETVNQIFSHLNLLQIKHVLDRFKPDELSPEPVPDKVKRAIDDACKRSGSQLVLELDPMKIERVNLLSEL